MDSETVKRMARRSGADICRIAPATRFVDAPKGFHPRDTYEDCESVIVVAVHFPLSTLKANTNAPYTFVRNMLVQKIDLISFQLSGELEAKGVESVPIPSAEPYDYWDPERRHGRGILSLKHAGALCGVGVFGKNTLLINDVYGNMMWLGAILVSATLEPDPIASYEGCIPECTLCLDSCPQHALDGTTLDQLLCRKRSTSSSEGGGWVLSCNICRSVCPNHAGIL